MVYGHRRSLVIQGGCGAWPLRRAKRAVCRAKRAEVTGGLAVHTQGNAYATGCTHKAVHTQGGLWPPEESCYFRGGAGAGSRVQRSKPKRVKGGEGKGGEELI